MMRFTRSEIRCSSVLFPAQVLVASGLMGLSPAFASPENGSVTQGKKSASECVEFKKLPESFANELSLELKTAQIRFLPFEFPVAGSTSGSSANRGSTNGARKGFVLQNLESCGLRGSCDSLVYLSMSPSSVGSENSKPTRDPACYRGVLEFTGRWNGVVHARNEKHAPASVRVDHRVFEWNEKSFRFEEKTK